jgi:hypothetical protein
VWCLCCGDVLLSSVLKAESASKLEENARK